MFLASGYTLSKSQHALFSSATCCLFPKVLNSALDKTVEKDIKRGKSCHFQQKILGMLHCMVTIPVIENFFSISDLFSIQVSLCTALLLAFVVYIMAMSDQLPKTSDSIPLIRKFNVMISYSVTGGGGTFLSFSRRHHIPLCR